MYENRICCDYRDGKVTKEELDKCSTCDVNCVINNGLSEASKEQLKHKSGEQIVDEDIAKQGPAGFSPAYRAHLSQPGRGGDRF